MKRLLGIAALALPLLSACGEKEEQPFVLVHGRATIEKPAENFELEVLIEERSKDRLQSLAAASARLDEIRDKLARLEGLESFNVEAEELTAITIRPRGCDPTDRYDENYPDECRPLDHLAAIKVTVKGQPASVAGNVFSLVTELGAEAADELQYRVNDAGAAASEARQAALFDALEIAKTLARQTNSQVSRPIEIAYDDSSDDVITVTGSRVMPEPKFVPTVTLNVPSKTVSFSAKVTAKFALEELSPQK